MMLSANPELFRRSPLGLTSNHIFQTRKQQHLQVDGPSYTAGANLPSSRNTPRSCTSLTYLLVLLVRQLSNRLALVGIGLHKSDGREGASERFLHVSVHVLQIRSSPSETLTTPTERSALARKAKDMVG